MYDGSTYWSFLPSYFIALKCHNHAINLCYIYIVVCMYVYTVEYDIHSDIYMYTGI